MIIISQPVPTDILYAILIVLSICLVVQLYYWAFRFKYKDKVNRDFNEKPVLSVVICAKNELSNLQKMLPSILDQKYPQFEVVVCDDFSTDETWVYLQSIHKKYSFLTITTPDKDLPGKKHALKWAVEQAKNEKILVTDADCHPSSERWIELMAGTASKESKLILGYGPFKKNNGLLNIFARFECVFTAIQYLSAAMRGRSYMGVGRNMLFNKSDFLNYSETTDLNKTVSGDDDLFVNSFRENVKVEVSLNPKSFMVSKAPSTWYTFFKQKHRHISTSLFYNDREKFALVLYPLCQVFFYISLLFLLFTPLFAVAFAIYILRMISITFFWSKWLNILKESDLKKWMPLLDLLLGIYYIIMFPFLFIKRKNNW